MIAFVLALATLLSSPVEHACDVQGFPIDSVKACRASCVWWSKYEKRCRDVDVEVIGPWDPRPAAHEWATGYYSTPSPPEWGTYPTEKAP